MHKNHPHWQWRFRRAFDAMVKDPLFLSTKLPSRLIDVYLALDNLFIHGRHFTDCRASYKWPTMAVEAIHHNLGKFPPEAFSPYLTEDFAFYPAGLFKRKLDPPGYKWDKATGKEMLEYVLMHCSIRPPQQRRGPMARKNSWNHRISDAKNRGDMEEYRRLWREYRKARKEKLEDEVL